MAAPPKTRSGKFLPKTMRGIVDGRGKRTTRPWPSACERIHLAPAGTARRPGRAYLLSMGTDTHAFLSDLARGLAPRADQLVDAVERGTDEISATCLYAVYDPVSRACSLAGAGHFPPAVVTPPTADGAASAPRAVDFPELLPIGPPLGLGGLPFETAQFELPPGSRLVLYTDGLVKSRSRDLETSLALLRDVLARAPASLEETCDELLSALLPSRPTDDVALLVARTAALDADQVATWNLSSDPAFVSQARAHVSRQLTSWGLEEMAFTTELVVSELVTNAIRYGKSPIQLRMILQSALTCEVSDASSTAPHLRRARVFDEGGRGLLLVAQLTEHWGTRHNREGKVIWPEQLTPA